MGDFEVFNAYFLSLIFGVVIYNVINVFFYKNLVARFGFFKTNRKDFYECGFKPINQKSIKIPIQFLLICIFFLIYDIELLFFFPFLSGISYIAIFDFFIFFLFIFFFIISLFIDYNKHAIMWQY